MSIPRSLFSTVTVLSGNNYQKWKEELDVALAMADLDISIRETKPMLTGTGTIEEKATLEKWETADRKSILIMKKYIPEDMKDSVVKKDTTKEYLVAIKEVFHVSQLAEKGDLMNQLPSAKFDGNGSVREYLLQLASIAKKLKDLRTTLDDDFRVHLVLKSLPQ
ncbi:uncharacterized protein LOC122066654 [Macadamia integrifolia]|uniref:uncharacterized protein LOC122066654 n=1 Tax=Macadamia integrifolia TaxID=60698 RepID=UPI001C4F481D|nr:uncharacterized protein LOC122066654 [Macadamia integrifolia]